MTDFIGNLGGITIGAESIWNTAVVPDVELWCISSTLKPDHAIVETEHLAFTPQNFTEYTVQTSLGEITSHWSFEKAIIGDVLGNLTADATNIYVMGTNAAPVNPGLSILQNTGGSTGMAWIHSGCKINSLTISAEPNKYPRFSMSLVGGSTTADAEAAITLPAITSIATHADFANVTINSVVMGCNSVSVTIERPLSGADRVFVGGTTLTEPVQVGPFKITATMNVDLSNTLLRDSEDILEKFKAKTALGVITMGSNISLAECRMTGDWPALGEGIQKFPINVVATSCAITTTV